MKKLVLISLLLMPLTSMAGKASGGGDVVDVIFNDGTSKTELYDLVSEYTCDWKKGDEVLSSRPSFIAKINKLKKLDWYFARELEIEARGLNYCFTKSLLPVFTKFPTNPDHEKTKRAAFRLGSDVYWTINSGLDSDSEDFLIFHEVLHSYIDQSWFYQLKYLRLTSMVNSLRKVWSGEISSREDLHFEMTGNQVQFPQVNELMDKNKEQILFYLGDKTYKISAIKKSNEPTRFRPIDFEVVKYLSVWDQKQFIHYDSLQTAYFNALADLLSQSDLESFKVLLSKDFGDLDIFLFSLNLEDRLSVDKNNYLHSLLDVRSILLNAYDEIMNIDVYLSDTSLKRPMLTKNFSKIYHETNGEDLSFVSIDPGNIRLSPSLNYLVAKASSWINDENWQLLEVYITEQDMFYESFGFNKQASALASMEFSITREKPISLRLIKEISESLLQTFIGAVSSRIDTEENKNKWIKSIQYDRFTDLVIGAENE